MLILRRIATLILVLAMALAPVPAGAGQIAQEEPVALVLYRAPIAAEVVDPFRPPAHIGAPGNRGLEYGSSRFHLVQASAPGHIEFAGQVAGRMVLSVQHFDGVRTTYTGLEDVWVAQDDFMSQGSFMGVAGPGFHFGARLGDHYLDPQILIDASESPIRSRLVPAPG